MHQTVNLELENDLCEDVWVLSTLIIVLINRPEDREIKNNLSMKINSHPSVQQHWSVSSPFKIRLNGLLDNFGDSAIRS